MVQLVPLDLPGPKDEPLARSPLRLVAFQLRHTPTPTAAEVSAGFRLHEALGGQSLWRLEPLQASGVRITAGSQIMPSAAPLELPSAGWKFVSPDGKMTIAVQPESLALEATTYPGWQHFSAVLDQLLDTASSVLQPEAEVRLGLRYINRIEEPPISTPQDWSEWIDGDIVAILRHRIGPGVTAAQQQLQIDTGGEIRAAVQHGFFQDPNTSRLTYVMDFDTYREGVRPFRRDDAKAAVSALHTFVLQLFQSMITEQMYDFLRG